MNSLRASQTSFEINEYSINRNNLLSFMVNLSSPARVISIDRAYAYQRIYDLFSIQSYT